MLTESSMYSVFFIDPALLVLIALSAWAWLTNPFNRLSIFRKPFSVTIENGSAVVTKNHNLNIRRIFLWRFLAYFHAAWYIVTNVYWGSKKTQSSTIQGIVKEIHALRFNPYRAYLISGDHFVVQYPRNLGVFYLPTLDTRTALDKEDWANRQRVYAQTLIYDLQTFIKAGKLTTTIVPVSPRGVSLINIYAYPSDTLYGMLFALKVMLDDSELKRLYPFTVRHEEELQTRSLARQLIKENTHGIRELFNHYYKSVFDDSSGLIKNNVRLSSAKDITKRYCAFYDNVIFWRTLQLMNDLNIDTSISWELEALKKRILETFWYSEEGYFIEDLSDESVARKHYSSDWLVVLFTGFLDPAISSDREFLTKSIEYIRRHRIAEPFPMKYQPNDRAHRQFPIVRLAVPAYGGSAIWSFWGIEYIRLLLRMYQETGVQVYLEEAGNYLHRYEANMIRDHGFPEVYSAEGKMLTTLLYKSIRQTGWVINYVQAKRMYDSIMNRSLSI
ncbi:hypothetical protein HGA91_00025 [candidate division WWE3 bacterium]|nr:hypothetical protein [candidate division WWE3 bacterium]